MISMKTKLKLLVYLKGSALLAFWGAYRYTLLLCRLDDMGPPLYMMKYLVWERRVSSSPQCLRLPSPIVGSCLVYLSSPCDWHTRSECPGWLCPTITYSNFTTVCAWLLLRALPGFRSLYKFRKLWICMAYIPVTTAAASSKSPSVGGYTAWTLGAMMHDCVKWIFAGKRAWKKM